MKDWIKDNGFAFVQGLFIGGFAAFILFFMFVKDPLPLDPIQAYCRGSVDIIAYSRAGTGQPWNDQMYDENVLLCLSDVRDGALLSDAMRGPLLPEYE